MNWVVPFSLSLYELENITEKEVYQAIASCHYPIDLISSLTETTSFITWGPVRVRLTELGFLCGGYVSLGSEGSVDYVTTPSGGSPYDGFGVLHPATLIIVPLQPHNLFYGAAAAPRKSATSTHTHTHTGLRYV